MRFLTSEKKRPFTKLQFVTARKFGLKKGPFWSTNHAAAGPQRQKQPEEGLSGENRPRVCEKNFPNKASHNEKLSQQQAPIYRPLSCDLPGVVQNTKTPEARKYEKKMRKKYTILHPGLNPKSTKKILKNYENGHFPAIVFFFKRVSRFCFNLGVARALLQERPLQFNAEMFVPKVGNPRPTLGQLLASQILYALLVGEKQHEIARARFCTQSCPKGWPTLGSIPCNSPPMKGCIGSSLQ